MANRIYFKCTFGQINTLTGVSKVIEKRCKYLNETAFQSIHAIAIDTLKSIRGVTKVANPSKLKVSVSERSDLRLSYTTENHLIGGSGVAKWAARNNYDVSRMAHELRKKMCLRSGQNRVETDAKVIFFNVHHVPVASVKVYEFVDSWAEGGGLVSKKYLIAAKSQNQAKTCAKRIVGRRLLRFAGLAKRAISALMIKANSSGPSDGVSARVFAKANEVTNVRNVTATNSDGGGKYALILEDDLRYATSPNCLRGGQAAVDLALKKAANKSVGLIQQKCKNLLLPGELPTPFPEITKRRAG